MMIEIIAITLSMVAVFFSWQSHQAQKATMTKKQLTKAKISTTQTLSSIASLGVYLGFAASVLAFFMGNEPVSRLQIFSLVITANLVVANVVTNQFFKLRREQIMPIPPQDDEL